MAAVIPFAGAAVGFADAAAAAAAIPLGSRAFSVGVCDGFGTFKVLAGCVDDAVAPAGDAEKLNAPGDAVVPKPLNVGGFAVAANGAVLLDDMPKLGAVAVDELAAELPKTPDICEKAGAELNAELGENDDGAPKALDVVVGAPKDSAADGSVDLKTPKAGEDCAAPNADAGVAGGSVAAAVAGGGGSFCCDVGIENVAPKAGGWLLTAVLSVALPKEKFGGGPVVAAVATDFGFVT